MGSSPSTAPTDAAVGAPAPQQFVARHDRVRSLLRDRRVDALIVGHLPNIASLSGFSGSAGVVVMTAGRLYLLIDFRYSAALHQAVRIGAVAPGLDVIQVEGSYDRQLVAFLADRGFARIGFEAPHLSVARYDWLRRALTGIHGEAKAAAPAVEWVPIDDAVEL